MKNYFPLILLAVLLLNCSSDSDSSEDIQTDSMYFPPISGNVWETKSMSELGWNESEVQPLLTFLEEKHTKGFI
ncbi:MAG: serine hydrolase, partial [Bacteroidetes bacterium HGW-Bacteroidetes-23]